MELPEALRAAVDAVLAGASVESLGGAAEALSLRYRGEVRDGRWHVGDDLAARAYLATRLPATYAAIRATFAAVADSRPDFAPESILDAGAGPGSATWAAVSCWPSLRQSLLFEGSAFMRSAGETLAKSLPVSTEWRDADLSRGLPETQTRDLVLLAYVLDELAPERRGPLVDALWAATGDTLVVIEPGTPAGWRRILEARAQLIAAGAHLLAPCPHAAVCPIKAPDWCHFARRVARSRIHRLAKAADAPWEDEKFIYVAASRKAGRADGARVLAPPRTASGRVWLKLCEPTGEAEEKLFTRRQGDVFRAAKDVDWGDRLKG